jgi:hypothetical protein
MISTLLPAFISVPLLMMNGVAASVPHEPAYSSTPTAEVATPQTTCEVTEPNGQTPPGERSSRGHHGNGALWTVLWSEGTVVFKPGGSGFVLRDGSLQMKFPWWRTVRGQLRIEGRRLDAPAPPLRAQIPSGYGDRGFQATYLIFSTPGCWEVTGRAGEASLTFITKVVRIGEGPVRRRSGYAAQQAAAPDGGRVTEELIRESR